MEIKKLDPVIHERVRLGILGLLIQTDELTFSELKETLKLSDGNLASHLRTLEENGIIEVRKTFIGRKPKTFYRLTQQGKRRFLEYLDAITKILSKIVREE